MTLRLRVEHTSRYRYSAPVYSSYNEARITPLTTASQLVLDSSLSVDPPAAVYSYIDYWGTVVHAFDLHLPHEEMVITGRSVVETGSEGGRATGEEVTWSALRTEAVRDSFAEYLAPTARVPRDDRLAEVSQELSRGTSPAQAVLMTVEWVRDQLSYLPGSTAVHTSAIEAWEGGAGVCQDFAHLTIGLLRCMGIPARYCSGYVHPNAPARAREPARGESHAWVESWIGEWNALDPTAGEPVGLHHVLVARGRDYADVPPVKGVFHGGPSDGLDVSVTLTRLG